MLVLTCWYQELRVLVETLKLVNTDAQWWKSTGMLGVLANFIRRGRSGLWIDAYGLKIQGRGNLMFLTKFLGWGGQGFQKNCRWGGWSPFFGFYCIFINMCFEICLRGGTIFTLTPLCASMGLRETLGGLLFWCFIAFYDQVFQTFQ